MKENLEIIACLCAIAAGACAACMALLCIICAPFAIVGFVIYKCLELFR